MAQHLWRRAIGYAVLGSLLACGAAQAEDRLRAIVAYQSQYFYAKTFATFVEKLNAAGKGVVQIQVVGGPEAIPPFEQADAVRTGVVDMLYAPGTYYLGLIPEADAVAASSITPMDARADGAFEILRKPFAAKMNVEILGVVPGGVPFNIFLKEEPKIGADGVPDLTGVKLRGSPTQRDFLTQVGATFVQIPLPETYTALERGVVDGMATPIVGVMDLGWDKFLKYRIEPGVFQTDNMIYVNLDKWNALSEESRKILKQIAEEQERESYDFAQEVIQNEKAALAERGMKAIELSTEGAEKYKRIAQDAIWGRLEKNDPTYYEELRSKLDR
ncbi:TRAP transporter substrate-binding protein DctP [Faunimonas sp. B44]|uniref:TRAP transporter substrate-binding protein DctP n=1 Tax=Faunimonas sp. B44 TaxID=3461493 RepID=UPI0040449979